MTIAIDIPLAVVHPFLLHGEFCARDVYVASFLRVITLLATISKMIRSPTQRP